MSEEVVVPEVPEVPAATVTDGQNPAAEAPAPVEKPAEKTDEHPEKGVRRFERKLDRAYRRAAEAEAKAQLFERQLNELRPQATTGGPKIEDFNDVQEYAKAYAKHETEKAISERDVRQREQAATASQAQLKAQWEAKSSKADSKYDDFDEVVGELSPTTPWAVALMQAENGDDIAYYLGKNMGEARRITSLDPVSQIREIGRLEAKLALEPPKPKTPSKAPAPIAPLGGTSGVSTDSPSENDDMKTWIRKRQKQVHRS